MSRCVSTLHSSVSCYIEGWEHALRCGELCVGGILPEILGRVAVLFADGSLACMHSLYTSARHHVPLRMQCYRDMESADTQ